jgi:hypothetical protein
VIKKLICGSFKLVHPKIWLLQKLPDFFRKVPQGNSLSSFFTVPSTWVSRAHDTTRLSFKYFIPMAERQQRDAPVHIALAIYWFFLQEDIRVTCQTCQTRLSASVEHRNLPTDKNVMKNWPSWCRRTFVFVTMSIHIHDSNLYRDIMVLSHNKKD